ncbi:MAG: hypothetical protein QNJ09_11920 [Paracoccaceae bacterium]|nr:hypothetical protein [Paracoccaceae bacterium]
MDTLTQTLTYDGQLLTATSIQNSLDIINDALALRVLKTTFDGLEQTVQGIEQVFEAVGNDGAALVETVQVTRRQTRDLARQTQQSMADAWEAFEADQALREAQVVARRELRGTVDDLLAAEVEERLQLQADT